MARVIEENKLPLANIMLKKNDKLIILSRLLKKLKL